MKFASTFHFKFQGDMFPKKNLLGIFVILIASCVFGCTQTAPVLTNIETLESLQEKFASCRTGVDVRACFGAPQTEYARGENFAVYYWDWTASCLAVGLTNGCCGFAIGVSTKDDILYWWAPSWFGSVPEGIPARYDIEMVAENDGKIEN